MSSRWSRNALLLVMAILVAVGVLAWGPIHSVLTIERANIDLPTARRQLASTPNTSTDHEAASTSVGPSTTDGEELAPASTSVADRTTPTTAPSGSESTEPLVGVTTTRPGGAQ